MSIVIKRVYEKPHEDDGTRILVDRLWPRGLSKQAAHLDDWMKDIAPSDELRKWFGHREERWEEFHRAYSRELAQQHEHLLELRKLARHGPVTLLYAAKNEEQNNAVVIRDYLSRGDSKE